LATSEIAVTLRIAIERGVAATMRDGCVLLSDVYRPDDAGPHPVVLVRTPYDRTYAAGVHGSVDAIRMAEKGFAVIVQDVRGRFGSDGHFEAYEAEAEDGYDSVEWAAALPSPMAASACTERPTSPRCSTWRRRSSRHR
jgi:predicted acyl esterase